MNHQSSDNSGLRAYAFFITFVAICLAAALVVLVRDGKILNDAAPAAATAEVKKTTCEDVTTYDQNWQNDVLCTQPDGATFYTDYAGGREADSTFER